MKSLTHLPCLVLLLAPVVFAAAGEPSSWIHGAVASVHPLATRAGLAALQHGGNAVDAAVATAITLGVVDGHNSGLGGGCFILIRSASGELAAIDARETAPALATRDMFLRDGKADEALSQTGSLAVATPGALAGYAEVLRLFGKLSLSDLLLPAADLAEQGFPIDAVYARRIASTQEALSGFPETRRLLLHEDGTPLHEGEILRQPELAQTLRHIAQEGPRWFYQGDFATRVGAWMEANGGVLRAGDFAAYKAIRREPLRTAWRGFTILGFPPPSSGGAHVAQILGMLERFDLAGAPPAEREHLLAEAMKLAFADRAFWLGDPAFTRVPRGLLDAEYIASLSQRINPTRATSVPGPGQPPRAETDLFGDALHHTTHLSTADAEGNWVALTQTVNTSFGSKVIVPGTGVILNNEMDDFSAAPGARNAFGLVGAEANAVAPGKRPLSSMSPTLVLKGDEPILSVGAAGGPTIISQTVQNLIGFLELHRDLTTTLAAPRLHHQWSPDELRVEPAMGAEIIAALQARGHHVIASPTVRLGASQAVARDPATGRFSAAHDPRIPGEAAGW